LGDALPYDGVVFHRLAVDGRGSHVLAQQVEALLDR
jgi:hypothetical protein